MEKEIPSVPKRDCSVFPAGALRLALLPGFSYHKGFLSFPAAGGRSLRAESHIFGGVRFVHVQFRKADFSALLEEFDAQPVGGDGVKCSHAFDESVARKLEHAQHFRFIGVHGFLRIADAGGGGSQGTPVDGDPLASLVGLNDEAVVALFNFDVHGAQGGRGFQGEFQHQGLVFRGGSVQFLNGSGVPVHQFGRVHTASGGGFQLVVLHFLRGTSQQFQFTHAAFQAVPVRGNAEQAAGTLSQAGVIRGNPGFFLLFIRFVVHLYLVALRGRGNVGSVRQMEGAAPVAVIPDQDARHPQMVAVGD